MDGRRSGSALRTPSAHGDRHDSTSRGVGNSGAVAGGARVGRLTRLVESSAGGSSVPGAPPPTGASFRCWGSTMDINGYLAWLHAHPPVAGVDCSDIADDFSHRYPGRRITTFRIGARRCKQRSSVSPRKWEYHAVYVYGGLVYDARFAGVANTLRQLSPALEGAQSW